MKKAKKKNGYRTLSVMMALSISAAVFFGYKSYSVDHKLDIPVIDSMISGGTTTTASAKSTSTSSSKSTSSKSSSSKSSGSSQMSGMMMQLGQ